MARNVASPLELPWQVYILSPTLVALSIDVIGNPRVVILDEPSSGLDPGSKRGIWDVIRQVSPHLFVSISLHLAPFLPLPAFSLNSLLK